MKDKSVNIVKIGEIISDFKTIKQCPSNGWVVENVSSIVLNECYVDGLEGIEEGMLLHVLWWFHLAERDMLTGDIFTDNGVSEMGVFALRSPQRPNPIALSLCEVIEVKKNIIVVRGLEAISGSMVIDIKKAIQYHGFLL